MPSSNPALVHLISSQGVPSTAKWPNPRLVMHQTPLSIVHITHKASTNITPHLNLCCYKLHCQVFQSEKRSLNGRQHEISNTLSLRFNRNFWRLPKLTRNFTSSSEITQSTNKWICRGFRRFQGNYRRIPKSFQSDECEAPFYILELRYFEGLF